MSSLLDPNCGADGPLSAGIGSAVPGLALGDHARRPDVLEAADNPNALPRQIGPVGHQFNPYVNNGGTVVAVSGADFSIVASDTRLGLGYAIPSRYVSRVLKLTDKAVLASSGMQADISTLHKILRIRLAQYFHTHQKDMTLEAIAQMLSNMLYFRRFQPYYTFNVLGGIDQHGKGWSYGYDAIGSHEKVKTVCSGTGQTLLQPVLDNQVEHRQMSEQSIKPELSLVSAVELVKDAFASTGERDIYTGDTVEIFKVTSKGVDVEKFELRLD